VQANNIDMRLVHITTRAFDELTLKRGNTVREVKQKMDLFSKARLAFSAPIITNLSLSYNSHAKEKINMFSGGSDNCEFTLRLTTTSAQTYSIYFDKYFL